MLWVYGLYKYFTLSVRGLTLYSDVYRFQILTSKVDPRTERFRGFVTTDLALSVARQPDIM